MFDFTDDYGSAIFAPIKPINQDSIVEEPKIMSEAYLRDSISHLITSDSAKEAIFKGHSQYFTFSTYERNLLPSYSLAKQFR